jgi:hypothetical protein
VRFGTPRGSASGGSDGLDLTSLTSMEG